MPNHCSNRLTIVGPSDQLSEFKSKSLQPDEEGEIQFTMSVIDPTPEEYLEKWQTGEVYWRDWRIKNWGTKWDCYTTVIHQDDDLVLEVSYQTAWSPNIPFLVTASNAFPELSFTLYYMEGSGFCGKIILKEGKVLDNLHGDVKQTDEDGVPVVWDSDKRLFKYEATGEYLNDKFYPLNVNPYEDAVS